MKAIVHIGLMKTGTSAIQRWLAINREDLASMGFHYDPLQMPGLVPVPAHSELSLCALSQIGQASNDASQRRRYGITDLESQNVSVRKWTKMFEDSIAQAGDRTVVLSAEGLSTVLKTPVRVRGLADWLSGYFSEVQYVMYVRRQPEWAVSFYSQALRDGSTLSLDEFAEVRGRTDFCAIADLWAGVVGQDNLTIRVYRDHAETPWNAVSDFAEFLGVDETGLKPAPRANTSFDVPRAEFLRRANAFLKSKGAPEERDHLLSKVRPYLTRTSNKSRKLRLSRTRLEALLAATEESNERLRATYIPDMPRLFPDTVTAPEGEADDATLTDVARVGLQLFWIALKHDPLFPLRTAMRMRRPSRTEVHRGHPRNISDRRHAQRAGRHSAK